VETVKYDWYFAGGLSPDYRDCTAHTKMLGLEFAHTALNISRQARKAAVIQPTPARPSDK
jgi:hypothetical protein